MTPRRPHRRHCTAAFAAAALAATTLGPAGAVSAAQPTGRPTPGIRLVVGEQRIEVDRIGAEPQLFLNDIAFLESTHGAFELDVRRTAHGVTIRQVRRSGARATVVRTIRPAGPVSMVDGLPKFLTLTLRTTSGAVLQREQVSYCPAPGIDAQRVSPNSAAQSRFPQTCGDALTQVIPWGIDAGWASGISTGMTVPATTAPDGTYRLQVAITPSYARQFRLSKAASTKTLTVQLVTVSAPPPAEGSNGQSSGASTTVPVRGRHTELLPDLVALPAHDLSMQNDASGASVLGFAGSFWNGGPGSLDVEGFRQGARPTMQARQYIDRPGKAPKSVVIGHFEFDTRPGHHHWHLEDVVTYALLNHDATQTVRSAKQSFCIAPTDPVNLLRPGAVWVPGATSLASACPTEQGLWLRESLPVGWGDTYFQTVAGQAFDVTTLPNGTYYLRVRANPAGRIHEVRHSNDTSYLRISLGGSAGDRTVSVMKPVTKP